MEPVLMPLYEYSCKSCGAVHEFLQRMGERPKRTCPECGGRLEKLISRSGFTFKGSGWYVTDYSSKGKAPKDEKPKDEKKAASGSDGDAGSKSKGGEKPKSAAKAASGT